MTKAELKRVCVKPYDKDRFEVIQDYEFALLSFKGIVPKGFKTEVQVSHAFFGLCFHLLKVSILALVWCMIFYAKKQIQELIIGQLI